MSNQKNKEEPEEKVIESLSQALLFRQQPDKPNEFSLFLAAKIYLCFMTIECESQINEESQIAPKNYEQMYADLIMRADENIARQHIEKQAGMPAWSAEVKFRQLVLYANLKS